MVPLSEGESNELFETLSDWEQQLQHLGLSWPPKDVDDFGEPTP